MEYYESSWLQTKSSPDIRKQVDVIRCGICHESPVSREGETCYSCQARQLNAKYDQEQERICSTFVLCPECHRMPARVGDVCNRCRGKRNLATA